MKRHQIHLFEWTVQSEMDKNCTELSYCGCNQNFGAFWQSNGISKCFYYTLAASVLILCSLGITVQVFFLKRYGTRVTRNRKRPQSYLYKLQILVIISLVCLAVVEIGVIVQMFGRLTSGCFIATTISRLTSGFGALCLVLTEGKRTTSTKTGQSCVFIFYCTSLLLLEIACVVSWDSKDWWFGLKSKADKIHFSVWVTRTVLSTFMLALALLAPGVALPPNPRRQQNVHTDPLVTKDDDPASTKADRNANASTWRGFKRKGRTLLPYLWPAESALLKTKILLCIALLVAGRVVNPYVPVYSKGIVNALMHKQEWNTVLKNILLFVAFKLLQGSGLPGGVIHALRSYFWIRVRQYTTRTVQAKLFKHLHSLPLQWHLARKTGEVMESMHRGTTSINTLLYYIFFNLLPALCDVVIAVVYFMAAFNLSFGIFILVWLAVYFTATIYITEWKTKFQRAMNTKDNKAKQVAYDSLLNCETVKFCNSETYEADRFDQAIANYQASEYLTGTTLILLNVVQMIIMHTGLLVGTILCAKYVVDGTVQVGDFVLFETYMSQLYQPMGTFGHFYRLIQNCFINLENLLELFDEKVEITDQQDAAELSKYSGKVEFRNISLHYNPEKPILRDVSFTVEAGQSFALVGDSGSGKSSIIRLLLRFFEPTSGSIKIDGKDIRSVTQESLRDCVGLVPQDIVLFNDNILNNVRYSRKDASFQEVEKAARTAQLHERIVAMPDPYDTMVGERGLKLSGGEKQRVAIARTLLKAPSIVLLDEATSALDLNTTKKVQVALEREFRDKTSIVVPHSLSSITKVDCILVLKDGEIVERGRHQELLDKRGVYSEMWGRHLLEASGITDSEDEMP